MVLLAPDDDGDPDDRGEPSATPARRAQRRSLATRETILNAAVDVLVDEGYAHASTLRIQKRAGVSRGALLHHYPSRVELLVAAVHHVASERVRGFVVDSTAPADPYERVRFGVHHMWSTFAQPFFWASVELWTAARTEPRLRAVLPPLEREIGRLNREQSAVLFGPAIASVPGYSDVWELVFTSMRGVALAYSFAELPPDPGDRHVEIWAAAFDFLLGHPDARGPRDRVGTSTSAARTP